MKCLSCKHGDMKVVESREVHDSHSVRRRRECLDCGKRFTTYERVEMPQLSVVKKDDKRELFNRAKLLAGVRHACEKRPITHQQLDDLIADVERTLYESGEPEIASQEIGEMVMERLLALDDVAYVRFASVYRSFADVASFERELLELKRKHQKRLPAV